MLSHVTPPGGAAVLAVAHEVGELERFASLVRRRFRLVTAIDAPSALAAMRAEPDLAVVIALHQPPLIDGASILTEVRKLRPDCRRVLVAPESNRETHAGERAMVAAVNGCRPHHIESEWPRGDSLLQLLERLSDWFHCKRDARAAQAQVDADSSPVFGRRTALGSDVAPRPERFTTYHVRLSDIAASLRRDRSMACLFVDLSHLREVERELGPTHHADVMARAGDLLDRMRGDRLRRDDLICRTEDSDGYLCFLASPRDAGGSPVDLEAIASRVEANLERSLSDALAGFTREQPRVMVGFSRVLDNPMVRPERLLVRLVGEAHRSALLHRERAIQRHRTHLQEIILRGMLQSVYQPIVDMASGTIFGFEALARGPRDSSLESPTALFSVADEVELTFELDRACFRSALVGAAGLEPVHRLFVNLLPTSFYDSSFIESEVAVLLAAAELTPANVVFEITEKLAIENFASFRQALAGYTRAGFGVAIDDVGTRHSNLETVMALRPDFIKLSDVLTRGVSKSTVKREMVRSLQRIAEAIDAVIVAEGIEGPEDLTVLCDVGVRYGQGYFLARPGPPFPQLRSSVRRVVRAAGRRHWADVPAVVLVPDPSVHGDPVDGDGDAPDSDIAEPTRPGRIGRALRAADLAIGTATTERDDEMRAAANEARAADDAQRPAALLGARRASPVMDAFSDEETTSSDP